ncbi:mCG146935 [Mus musculus]|nr:mCG146935 [Mus musculus]
MWLLRNEPGLLEQQMPLAPEPVLAAPEYTLFTHGERLSLHVCELWQSRDAPFSLGVCSSGMKAALGAFLSAPLCRVVYCISSVCVQCYVCLPTDQVPVYERHLSSKIESSFSK